MTTEEWRPVPGFPSYQVSNLGRVMSFRGKQPRELVGGVASANYRTVLLYGDGTRSNCYVHQVVAAAFLGPRPDGMQIRHLNGDTQNNAASNLTYGTASENAHDRVRHGNHALANQTHCLRGHAFDEGNTHISKGHRECLTCRRQRDLDYRRRKRAAAARIRAAA